jgi:hypothetical protein
VASVWDSNIGELLELRWSPTCKTNWARINGTLGGSSSAYIKAVQSTGYTQWGPITNGVNTWSRQIYSPSLCVYAQTYGGIGTSTMKTTCS